MKAVFNPTGTHVQNGTLKIRVDIYPDPSSKTYVQHYVDKPDRPLTQEELDDPVKRALVPTHKELNPCLCHFIKVDETITKSEMEKVIRNTFDVGTLVGLDDALSNLDMPEVTRLMKPKSGQEKLVSKDTKD